MKTRRPAVQEKGSILFSVLIIVEDILNRRPEILLVLRRGNFQQRLINKCITREFFITQQYFIRSSFETILTLDAELLARSQYPEGPATGHLDTGFSWFPCVYKRMLRRFPSFQVASTCFSCSPPDLNVLLTFFHICVHVK